MAARTLSSETSAPPSSPASPTPWLLRSGFSARWTPWFTNPHKRGLNIVFWHKQAFHGFSDQSRHAK
eukprot:3582962-Pyramimonas_sp.AAC.1